MHIMIMPKEKLKHYLYNLFIKMAKRYLKNGSLRIIKTMYQNKISGAEGYS